MEVGLLGRRKGISGFAIEGEFEEENGAGDGPLITTNKTPDHVKKNGNIRGKRAHTAVTQKRFHACSLDGGEMASESVTMDLDADFDNRVVGQTMGRLGDKCLTVFCGM